MLSLSKLYSIDTHLQEALGKKVWLKCGGYLVIEPTEAMVDFINMESAEDDYKLLSYLDECLKKDKVKTRLVDMTALGIVEITRKKTSKPLGEWIKNLAM